MRFVLIAAIAASFLSQSAGARLAGNDAFTFRYEAFFSGFRIAEATTTLEWKDDRYAMQLHALSAGVLEWFITFDQLASSGGRLDHEVKAERHRNHNRSRDNWIDLRFRENTVEIVDANPDPASEEGRPAVPPELLIGALDPLSAALALGMSTRAADSCDSEVPVYDGRRRYDTILEHQRRETYRGPAGPAETLVCRFRFERRAGYTEEAKQWPGLTGSVWLQQVEEGLPMLPVRLEVETKYGTGYIHMVSAEELR